MGRPKEVLLQYTEDFRREKYRGLVTKIMRDKGCNKSEASSPKEYWRNLFDHKFVVSPRGGLFFSCHFGPLSNIFLKVLVGNCQLALAECQYRNNVDLRMIFIIYALFQGLERTASVLGSR